MRVDCMAVCGLLVLGQLSILGWILGVPQTLRLQTDSAIQNWCLDFGATLPPHKVKLMAFLNYTGL